MKKSIFITLPRNPGVTECEQHRTRSLDSILPQYRKYFLWIEMKKVRNRESPGIGKPQYGFVLNSGTRNAIFTLKVLMKRSTEVQKDLYFCLVDYSQCLIE